MTLKICIVYCFLKSKSKAKGNKKRLWKRKTIANGFTENRKFKSINVNKQFNLKIYFYQSWFMMFKICVAFEKIISMETKQKIFNTFVKICTRLFMIYESLPELKNSRGEVFFYQKSWQFLLELKSHRYLC